jgi:hypothetical protein
MPHRGNEDGYQRTLERPIRATPASLSGGVA